MEDVVKVMLAVADRGYKESKLAEWLRTHALKKN